MEPLFPIHTTEEMHHLIILLLALSLGMDAFAASVSCGMAPCFRRKQVLWLGLYFGSFQAGMAFLGSFIGTHFDANIGMIGRYVAFALLVFIGGKMVQSALSKKAEACEFPALSHGRMTVLAIATSIDALAAGFGLIFLGVHIFMACLVIGLVAAILSIAGGLLGERVAQRFCKRAELVGGLVLIALGIRSLF